jgi:hypothetical protein
VSAVTIRSTERSEAQNHLRESLREFQKAERARIKEPQDPGVQETMEYPLGGTSDESGDEVGQNGPLGSSRGQAEPKELPTTHEKAEALRECHDNPLAGHFGVRRTLKKIQRRYTWVGMRKDVTEYCKDCLACRKSTPARHKPYGLLAPLSPPSRPWEEVTMDFITELPPSKFAGVVYDAILVVVCRLTKMAHYIPAPGD